MENISNQEEFYRTLRNGIESVTSDSLFFASTDFNPKISLETTLLLNRHSSINLPRNLASELIYDISEVYHLDEEALLRKLNEKGYACSLDSEIPYEKLTPQEIAEAIDFSKKKQAA